MAETSIAVHQEHFNCSICLQLLKDPVTTPCGHCFCMRCINRFWDLERVYSCPDCRDTFNPRPVLKRNNMLAEVVNTLQKTEDQESLVKLIDSSCEKQIVECDVCVGEKNKAVKSCLTCLASFCDAHVQPHHESLAFKKHKLVTALRNLREKTCTQHDKLLEFFCRTDQRIICSVCLLDDHRSHDIAPVHEEFMERKKYFEDAQKKYQNKCEKREKILMELKELTEPFKSSAQTAVEDSERIFTELITFIEEKRSEATELIRAQEKAELDRASGLQEQLEQEIADLTQKHTDLQQLLSTNDYVNLLQRFQVLTPELDTDDSFNVAFKQDSTFQNFKMSVFQLKEELQDLCSEQWEIIQNASFESILAKAEPETREEFLQYYCELSLDPNTANNHLTLQEHNTRVCCDGDFCFYPNHPERFTTFQQVLCKHNVSSRSYWEVEVKGECGVSIAVCYKGIKRKGSKVESRFGHNSLSWRLVRYPANYNFWHNNSQMVISGPTSKRMGVYVDHKAGILAFYSVSNTMTLIHKVTTTFTEPLYPGFGIGTGSCAKICFLGDSLCLTQ